MFLKDAVWLIKLSDTLRNETIRQLSCILPWVPIISDKLHDGLNIIIGTSKTSPIIKNAFEKDLLNIKGMGSDDHIVKSIKIGNSECILITGNTEKGALYGVFSFLEEIGFYFLASNTVCPKNISDILVGKINKTYETKNKWRGMFVSFCMVSTSIMSLVDFQKLFDNMLRMKLNRIVFYPFENEPIIDYIFRGERKLVGDISRPESGYFSYGRHWTGSFNVDEIGIGREHYSPRKRVAPMEFQDTDSSDEALDTGKNFFCSIITEAKNRQIGVWLSFLPQFVSMNMTKYIKPMPRKNLHWSALVSCTDPVVKNINSARIINIVESYPELEGLFIGIPEGFYDDPYPESRKYIDSQMPEYEKALALEKKYWGDHWPGDDLQKKHMEADIAFSKIAIETLETAAKIKPDINLGLITVCKAYLLTKLDEILPDNISFCDIESRSLWTHGGAPLFLFKNMKKRECSIIPRITDDGSQAGMQFNLNLYYKDGFCQSTAENNTNGLMMQTLFIKGADHNIKYLAEGLWNTDIHPDTFYEKYLERLFGTIAYSKVREAYDILEKNEEFMGGRGAANMPWNHVPPEIAVMRSFRDYSNPYHSCPLTDDYLVNLKYRTDIYKKSIESLKKAAGLFEKALDDCVGSEYDECHYMLTRNRGYEQHLQTLIILSEVYFSYSRVFNEPDIAAQLLNLTERCRDARDSAIKTAELFSESIMHTTDLAPLWMINSSMVNGTKVISQYFQKILAFYEGREYWSEVQWNMLFGKCPFPAHGVNVHSADNQTLDEPG